MTAAFTGRRRFFATGRSQVVDEHDRALWDALTDQAEGGKGVRPLVLQRVYAALGGQQPELAATVGGAVELLHTAFVIHDDVIDDDDHRRGRPNVRGTFTAAAETAGVEAGRARRYGDTAAILAGDLALAGAVREMATCGARPGVVADLLDLLEEVLHRSAAGELADVRVSLLGNASVADALDIAEWKTAAYSFQLPLQAGAILAEADEGVVTALGEVGRALGIAYQLRDDVRGVFGTREETGKDPLGDLREGKCTALVAVARSTRHWDALAPHVGDPDLTPRGAAHARDLLIACGARQAVETSIADLRTSALTTATTLPRPAAEAVTSMIELFVPTSSHLAGHGPGPGARHRSLGVAG